LCTGELVNKLVDPASVQSRSQNCRAGQTRRLISPKGGVVDAKTNKMTKNVRHNTVELEFPFGLSFNQFYCPACGNVILEQDAF
jgi:hypothetical protein